MLIDINASFGGRESVQRFDVESLERELEKTPYSLVFVSANEGVFDQRTANDHLFELCRANARWLPTATLHPGDTFAWRDELERCRDAGVKLFRINPVSSGWAIDSILMDLLVNRLAGTGAALMVAAQPAGLASTLARRTAPAGLPVIFTDARYFPLTELIPLAQQFDHVYVETSRLTSPGGIGLCVREIGADRLLYGSGASRYQAGVACEMLQRAEITQAERELIAWKNAASLMGLAPPPLLSGTSDTGSPPPLSTVEKTLDELDAAERVRLGKAIDTAEVSWRGATADPVWRSTIRSNEKRGMERLRAVSSEEIAIDPAPFPPAIDIHLHDKFAGAPFPRFDPAGYEAELERNGVEAGVTSSATAIFHDLQRGNDENLALINAVPRLGGYVVVDPRYLDDSVRELGRIAASERWIGVKVHCAHAKTLTASKAMAELVAAVAERKRPILIHPLGDDWPEALAALAKRHSRLTIIAAHAGYGDAPHPTHDVALRLADSPNIVLEFCSTYLAPGAIRRGIESAGVERVLFGSDFPLISLEYMRVAYRDAELSPEEEKLIYVSNAIRLFPALGAFDKEDRPALQS